MLLERLLFSISLLNYSSIQMSHAKTLDQETLQTIHWPASANTEL